MSAIGLAVDALVLGVLLGTIFFGGLWFTVRHGVAAEHPAVWFASSLVVRSIIILSGFYFVSPHGLPSLLLCLLGLLIARAAVTRFTRPPKRTPHATQL